MAARGSASPASAVRTTCRPSQKSCRWQARGLLLTPMNSVSSAVTSAANALIWPSVAVRMLTLMPMGRRLRRARRAVPAMLAVRQVGPEQGVGLVEVLAVDGVAQIHAVA